MTSRKNGKPDHIPFVVLPDSNLQSSPNDPLKSPLKDRKSPVFYVSNQYDCIITAPPDKTEEVGAFFADAKRSTSKGYCNSSYEKDFDTGNEVKKERHVSYLYFT